MSIKSVDLHAHLGRSAAEGATRGDGRRLSSSATDNQDERIAFQQGLRTNCTHTAPPSPRMKTIQSSASQWITLMIGSTRGEGVPRLLRVHGRRWRRREGGPADAPCAHVIRSTAWDIHDSPVVADCWEAGCLWERVSRVWWYYWHKLVPRPMVENSPSTCAMVGTHMGLEVVLARVGVQIVECHGSHLHLEGVIANLFVSMVRTPRFLQTSAAGRRDEMRFGRCLDNQRVSCPRRGGGRSRALLHAIRPVHEQWHVLGN